MYRTMKLSTILLIAMAVFCACNSSSSNFEAMPSVSPGWGSNDIESASGMDISETGRMTLSIIEGWFDADWKYRKAITVLNDNDTVDDYQVQLSVEYEEGMSEDFSDLRFTDMDGEELSFWIEDMNEGDDAAVWVKVQELNDGTNTLFLYYGNPEAVDASDADSTFIFFDDFEVFEGWTAHGGGNLVQSDLFSFSGDCSIRKTSNSDPNGGYKAIGEAVGRGIALDFYVYRFASYSGGSADRIGLIDDDGNGYGWVYNHSGDTLGIDRRDAYSGVISGSISADDVLDGWVMGKLVILDSDQILAEGYEGGELNGETSYANGSYNSFTRVYIFGGHDYLVDWMRLRRQMPDDPAYQFAVEQGRYSMSGVAVSKILDTESANGVLWRDAVFHASESDVSVKLRTSDDANMNGAPDFASCNELASGTDFADNECVVDGHRYYQYQIAMISDGADTPFFENMSVNFESIEPARGSDEGVITDEVFIIRASAGPDRISAVGKSLTLDGSASEGEGIVYNWAVIRGNGTLTNPTAQMPVLTTYDSDENYDIVVGLTVRTAVGERSTDEMRVHVFAKPEATHVDSTMIGSASAREIIYGDCTTTGEQSIFELTFGDATIQMPCDSTDLYLDITKSDQPIMGIPDYDDNRGIIYFFTDSLEVMSGVINVASVSSLDIEISDSISLAQKFNFADANASTPKLLIINGNRAFDQFGKYVATGDFNDDGVTETIVGAPGISAYGGAYIFQSTSEISGIMHGSREYPVYSVGMADLIEGSGDDIILGPDNPFSGDRVLRKEAHDVLPVSNIYIIDGASNLTGVTVLDSTLISAEIEVADGDIYSMAMGDANGDGHIDIALGVDFNEVLVFNGPLEKSAKLTAQDASYVISGSGFDDLFGYVLAIGDVNGDASSDIIIGSPGYGDGAGAVYIAFGGIRSSDNIGVDSDATVLFIEGSDAGGRLGNDVLLVDTNQEGSAEIYSTIGENEIYKFDVLVPLSDDAGSDDGSTAVTSSPSCSLTLTRSKFLSSALIPMMLTVFLIVCHNMRKLYHTP